MLIFRIELVRVHSLGSYLGFGFGYVNEPLDPNLFEYNYCCKESK
jgi:hypothetical protein